MTEFLPPRVGAKPRKTQDKQHLMLQAFIDESGTPSPADGFRWFSVAALVTSSTRAIELHVRRAHRSLRRSAPAAELKAARSDERVIRRLLTAIAEEPCEVYAVNVDKRGMPANDAELCYRRAVARVVALVAAQHPALRVTLDRRFAKPGQRLELEIAIRAEISGIAGQLVVVEQADSIQQAGLQAADFVAWAFRRQCEGAEEWAAILAHRRVVIESYPWRKIKSGSAWGPITTAAGAE